MKKSTIVSLCGIILAFMVLQVISNKKDVYTKTEIYETKEEAIANFIGYANAYENIKEKEIYSTSTPKEFKESLSFRYRTYIKSGDFRNIHYSIPFMINYSLEEVLDKDIIKNYKESFANIEDYKRNEDITYFKLTGDGSNYYKTVAKSKIKEDGTISIEDLNISQEEMEESGYYIEEYSYYIVVINEDEGYVVDYYEGIY